MASLLLDRLNLLLNVGLCVSLLMLTEDMANTREGVLNLGTSLSLIASEAAWPSLKTSASPLLASASSSPQGASSSWEGSDSLLVFWPSSVAQDWAEPDWQLRCEVILQAWLHD